MNKIIRKLIKRELPTAVSLNEGPTNLKLLELMTQLVNTIKKILREADLFGIFSVEKRTQLDRPTCLVGCV